jgi:antitoxin component of MazEF toxin-antitoxin module
MEATVRKWGNSVGIRIPKKALASSTISLNEEVEIITLDKALTSAKTGEIYNLGGTKP